MDRSKPSARSKPLGTGRWQFFQFLPPPMLPLQDRQQLLVVDPFGMFEVDGHLLAERLVTLGHAIEQVPHRHDITQFERFSMIDQKS